MGVNSKNETSPLKQIMSQPWWTSNFLRRRVSLVLESVITCEFYLVPMVYDVVYHHRRLRLYSGKRLVARPERLVEFCLDAVFPVLSTRMCYLFPHDSIMPVL